MPMAENFSQIEDDFEILEAIGTLVDEIISNLMPTGSIQKTLRKWLVGHADLPEDGDAQACLMAMAADLEMFTPSVSGCRLTKKAAFSTRYPVSGMPQ
jgi:hypothetical protein